MSVGLYRARKAIKDAVSRCVPEHPDDPVEKLRWTRAGLMLALTLVDEELDSEAEREFVKSIKATDPISEMAKG